MEKEHAAALDEESTSFPTWIFESDFALPPKVCILAPGPRGRPHYADIPDDYCVIAVNKAVLIPEVKADMWLINLFDQDWFEAANEAFDGVCILWREAQDSERYSPAVEQRLSLVDGDKSYYFWIQYPGLDQYTMPFFSLSDLDHTIMSGGTVTGAALQLAYHFGAREVLLCGVDMSGDAYFDGSLSERGGHGEIWNSTKAVNFLIKQVLQKKSIEVATLSPTKLDVPFWDRNR